MGGGPKIRTGISIVDNTANQAVGVASLGTIGNSLEEVGKNIESGGQRIVKNVVGIFQPGGLNNLGNTILQNETARATKGGASNEDLQNIAGESGLERKYREGEQQSAEQAAASAAADVATAAAESKRQLESVISGAVERRRRSPGKALSLLSGGTSGTNTLLDIGKK